MYKLARRILFCLTAETAHDIALDVISAAERLRLNRIFFPKIPEKPREIMGLSFKNPVGLAAGFDKNGDFIDGLGSLGFGFLELGSVTPVNQAGNPLPRMFRIEQKEALINRMGFNNLGVDHVVRNMRKKRHYRGIVGINIGKNLSTPIEDANLDYLACLRKVYPYADYVAVNLSSPNTPGLRKLQYGEALKSLLDDLKEEQNALNIKYGRRVPIAIKISPDMSPEDIREISSELLAYELDGVIATNTTIESDDIQGLKHADEVGGVSGSPLTHRSTEVIQILSSELANRIPIIGVGGVMDSASAVDKIRAGASLVQIYTGLIYRGPRLIREAAEAIYSVNT